MAPQALANDQNAQETFVCTFERAKPVFNVLPTTHGLTVAGVQRCS